MAADASSKPTKVHTRYAQRIAEIIALLHEGKILYIQDLADRYRTSPRTIQRDLNNADRITLPLERTKDGGYRLKGPSAPGKFGLSELQRFAHLTGVAESLPSLERTTLERLLAPNAQPPLEYRTDDFENARAFRHLFEFLEQAIAGNAVACFDYKNRARRVEPYRLIQNHGSWYLAALEGDTLKLFRLSQIKNALPCPRQSRFEPQPSVLLRIEESQGVWFASTKASTCARLHIDPQTAAYFRSRALLPTQRIVRENGDGSLIVEATYQHLLQILPIIRYWIPHVRVLQPATLQDSLMDSLRQYFDDPGATGA